MKKVLALLLAMVLVLSLAACGGQQGLKSEDCIGTWVNSYKLTEHSLGGDAGDDFNNTIELYKGGTGRISWNNETTGENHGDISLKWEIADDIINIDYEDNFGNNTLGLEYNKEKEALVSVDGKNTFKRK